MIHAGKPVMSLDRLPATSNPMASPHTASLRSEKKSNSKTKQQRKAIPKQCSSSTVHPDALCQVQCCLPVLGPLLRMKSYTWH